MNRIPVKFISFNDKILAKIEKINSLETAKKFVGEYIYIEKENLPKLKKNEFYYIFNGIGDISNDTVIILNKGKILSYEIN